MLPSNNNIEIFSLLKLILIYLSTPFIFYSFLRSTIPPSLVRLFFFISKFHV